MEVTTLYEYYAGQDVGPTFADLQDEVSVDAYGAARAALLGERLCLPISLLRGAEILEYGPDTGENAVTFARWGARLTLVEPAAAAHAKIRAYFERFAPPGALRDLAAADVLTYEPARRFDLVVAEGFIYTVQPTERWLAAFARALVPGGLALVTYLERSAMLFELLLKVPFAALRRRYGHDRLATAKRLYRPKWDRIPHTRAFESWVMDVLDNPFVRLRYFIDAAQLVSTAAGLGFGLHSTWPSYRDGLENVWAKEPIDAAEVRARTLANIARCELGFVLGTKAYLLDDEPAAVVARLVAAALADADALVDADDAARAHRLARTLRELAAVGRGARVLIDPTNRFANGLALLEAWADIAEGIAAADLGAVTERLNRDPVLLDGWGTPNHFAVLRAGALRSEHGV